MTGPTPPIFLDSTQPIIQRWVRDVVANYRGMANRLSNRDKQDFLAICGLDPDTPITDALVHAKKLLAVWKVSARLSK